MEAIREIIDGNTALKIYPDPNPENPRKAFDPMGMMVCFHNRYSLGDDHNYNGFRDFVWTLAGELDPDARDRLERKDLPIREENDALIRIIETKAVILPLYLYDHSGITMKTSPFSCPWDSGQVGWIYLTREKALEEYGYKRFTKGCRAKVEKYLKGEVAEYDSYISGEVYGYRLVEIDDDGEETNELDSCWGFYGDVKHMADNIGPDYKTITEQL